MRLFVAGFAHSLKICKKLTFSFIYFGYWFFSTTIHAIRFFSTAPLIQNSLNQIFCGICQASWFFIWYQIICFWTSFNQSIYISTVSSLCLMSALLNCFITFRQSNEILKFIYSEKATKFCEMSIVDLTGST